MVALADNSTFEDYYFAGGLPFPVGTLNVWRCRKQGPRYVKFPRGVFYRPDTLKKYFESCEVRTVDM